MTRVVSIKLVADATGLTQGFNRASDAAERLRGDVAGAGKSLTESARTQRAEWATVGSGLTAVGVAVTGVGVAALKTGIQYNMLQQVTRASLTTLLGSAEAANAQMDKLDAFARNSPFAKQTFITAQQQMLAFGIETQKVLPYLDALQNAVAASGGSNADIAELAEIFGKISASSKITAIDLQQFGRRGVNAAEIIGSQMGKTGAQIREEITAGSLDADAALDALATGMATKFEGASDNVKNTFAGAMDRVKAAWRDFSSELAKPLVDPNGGGALVELLNWTADMMRAFEDLPGPVKGSVTALTGLVGVGSLAGGTLMLALPKILEFRSALAAIGGVSTLAKGGLSALTSFLTSRLMVGLVLAAATVYAFNKAIEAGKTPQSEFGAALKSTTNLVDALQMATTNTKSNYWTYGFRDSLKDLPSLMDQVADSNKNALLWIGPQSSKAVDNLKQMGAELAVVAQTDFSSVQRSFSDMVISSGMYEDQVETMLDLMPELRAEFANAATDIGLTASEGNILALAMGDIDYASEKSKRSLEGIAGIAVETTDAISKLADEILNFGSAQIDADRAAIALQDKIRSLNAIFEEGTASLNIYTDAGGKTESAMLDVVEAAKKQAAAVMEAGGEQTTANAILDEARQKLIDQRIALGEDADAAKAWANERVPSADSVAKAIDGVKASADALPPEKKVDITANTADATGKINSFRSILDLIPRVIPVDVQMRDSLILSEQGIKNKYGLAQGGTVGYAAGGTIPGYAGGSTVGIGGGVYGGTVRGLGTAKSDSITVRLSKGEEVIQEPYASLNRPLLKAINRGDFSPSMMQPQVVVQGGGNTQVSLAGATFKASIDGRPFTMMIDEQISGAFTGIGRGSMRRDGGF